MKLLRIYYVSYERLNNYLKDKHSIRYSSAQLNAILTPAQETDII